MRVILIDDERLARKELTNLLKDFKEIEIIGEASNADEAIQLIEKEKPDLIFLDIQMPEKNGFELLEELNYMPRVVFVTAYDEYALNAFSVNALDYLLKPVEKERLEKSILKIANQLKQEEEATEPSTNTEGILTENDQIFLKDGDKCWFVSLKDVRMFESEGNYVRVYFNEFKPLVLRSLNGLEARLEEKVFFRASRKFIVNLKWVTKIENWFSGGLLVHLNTGEKIEISRRQAVKFKDMMSL